MGKLYTNTTDLIIKKEYEKIMSQIIGGAIYGKRLTEKSPMEDLIVAAYFVGLFGTDTYKGLIHYTKDD